MSGSIAIDYPVKIKQATGYVGDKITDVMVLSFTDRIMITITQSGRLAQWVGARIVGAGEIANNRSSFMCHLTP